MTLYQSKYKAPTHPKSLPSTISTLNHTAKAPSVCLSDEAAELGVLEKGRDNFLLEFAGTENAPGSSMWQPAHDVFEFGIIENDVHLHREVVCTLEGVPGGWVGVLDA